MKIVYIAGPFRADSAWSIEKNIRRAEALSLEIWRLGAACICPHTNSRFFQGAAPDDVWLRGYLEILKRCDALLTARKWDESDGALAEVEFARARGIPVFHFLEDVEGWLGCQAVSND